MALAQTELPELKRFTFFVSRRFEEGRERFRLHMGHFATLAEAEEWLSVVREIYPGAWAGEAPGRKLRARAAAAAAAQAQYAAGPQPPHSASLSRTHTPAAARASTPERTAAPASSTPAASAPRTAAPPPQPAAAQVPVVHPAPPLPAAARAGSVAPSAPAKSQSSPPATAAAVPAAAPAPPKATALAPRAPAVPAKAASAPKAASVPATPAKAAAAPKPAAAAASAPAVTPPERSSAAAPSAGSSPAVRRGAKPGVKPLFEDSNLREVLKALGDANAGETREMKAPPPPPPSPEATGKHNALSDTQVLKMLENRRPESGQPLPAESDEGNIPLLKPDDTGTRRALKEAVASNAPVYFAVQLQWSVQPTDLESVPPLAIFSAYTLYTVEGSRDGRKWYGLRLGFFGDAISAKQVAHYVRSEFNSVAVVPVSPQEKSRASDQEIAATLAAPLPTRSDPMDEFKLIDEAGAARAAAAAHLSARSQPPSQAKRTPVGRALRQAGSSGERTGPGARDRRGSQTLEETLEILGASQLSIDTGNGTTLNDSGVRHLHVEVQKNSPFSRLLERLSERLKKS
jgi:hypothetical protein